MLLFSLPIIQNCYSLLFINVVHQRSSNTVLTPVTFALL